MKRLFIVLCFLLLSTVSFGQQAVFKADEVVWFGLDFSHAKMIGSEGFKNPQEIQNKLFDGWNSVILTESDKYDLKKAFDKQNLIYDLTIVEKRNANVNANELVINKDYSFGKDVVAKIIKAYRPEQKKGIGLVFIVESFNKLRENGTVYVTFFDIASKKVLLTEKLTGKAGGFGLKNYYAKSLFNIIKQCESDYNRWAKR